MPRAYPIFCENVKFKFGFSLKYWFQFIDYKKDFLSVSQNRGPFAIGEGNDCFDSPWFVF